MGSFANLDSDSCKMLGRILLDYKIDVIFSFVLDSMHIHTIFNTMDADHNGYLDFDEFIEALSECNMSHGSMTLKQKEEIFRRMAVRRINERDKVYFFDFWQSIMAVDTQLFDLEVTRLIYPVHGIFDSQMAILMHVEQMIKHQYQSASKQDLHIHSSHFKTKLQEKQSQTKWTKTTTDDIENEGHSEACTDNCICREEWLMRTIENHPFGKEFFLNHKWLDNWWNLYSFCVGASMLTQLTKPLNNNVFFSVIDAMNEIRGFQAKYSGRLADALETHIAFTWKAFEDLLQQPEIGLQIEQLLGMFRLFLCVCLFECFICLNYIFKLWIVRLLVIRCFPWQSGTFL